MITIIRLFLDIYIICMYVCVCVCVCVCECECVCVCVSGKCIAPLAPISTLPYALDPLSSIHATRDHVLGACPPSRTKNNP